MKKAAIYDRWLHVLGGGEKHTVSLAQVIAELGYKVEILTHRPTNLKELKKKFGLKELNFSIKYVPEAWDYQLTPYTTKYDLFVLSSFADIFESKAKKSIMSVFFPISQKLTIKEFSTRAIIVPLFRKLFQFNLYIQKDPGLITIGRNKAKKEISFELFLPKLAISTVEQFKVSAINTNVKFSSKVIHQKNIIHIKAISDKPVKQWKFNYPISKYSKGIEIKINNNLIGAFAELFIKAIPFFGERMKAGPRKFLINEIESYDSVVANSKFTAKWINNYWGVDSKVIYPPVDIEKYKASKNKKNMIISIGRFFVGGHNKKQLEMVKSFKKIYRYIPDWELHLVGSVNDGEIHRDYFYKVKEEAKGYPIFIHENTSFEVLKDLLSKSKIYWHASGLGIDENKYPVMIEHFGITIVEAIASGCIPIVINKGGPAEVANENGITWDNLKELEDKTIKIIKDKKQFKSLNTSSSQQLDKYTFATYKEKISNMINNI